MKPDVNIMLLDAIPSFLPSVIINMVPTWTCKVGVMVRQPRELWILSSLLWKHQILHI